MNKLTVLAYSDFDTNILNNIKNSFDIKIVHDNLTINDDELVLCIDEEGISLNLNKLKLMGDYTKLIHRVKSGAIGAELLVKAARIKGKADSLTALDATAGLGEDSLLLAAAGFNVKLYEYDPVIALLLKDTVKRAGSNTYLAPIVSRMDVIEGSSIDAMDSLSERLDVIYLDPMFPERNKSALIGKKFQILQKLESPCGNEEDLISSAFAAKPRKVVIKRPLKGDNLAGVSPEYSIKGKAVRYDCFTFA